MYQLRWTLVVFVINNVDAYPFSDLTCHLENTGITVLLSSKETKFGSIDINTLIVSGALINLGIVT